MVIANHLTIILQV